MSNSIDNKEIEALKQRCNYLQNELLIISEEKHQLLNNINRLMCNQPCECEKCDSLRILFRKLDR